MTKPLRSATALTSWARAIRSALEARGIAAAPLFERSGLDVMALADPQARYPVEGTTRLWAEAVAVTGDPAFGLSVARYVMPTNFHALGYAAVASRTLAEAFDRVVRYFRLVTDVAELSLKREREVYRFCMRLRPEGPPLADASLDASAAVFTRMARGLAGRAANPREVHLQRPAPADAEPYQRLFRCPLHFGARHNTLVYDRALFEIPLDGANADVVSLNEGLIERDLARLAESSITDRVRAVVGQRLPSGDPGEDAVARTLHMSRRTLQRRLAEEGTGYRAVVDTLRRQRAEALVSDPRQSFGEIAFLLGFSEVSAFSRAFRRWTGVSPSVYRGRGAE
jgi:AraC-like DNA-binding protein